MFRLRHQARVEPLAGGRQDTVEGRAAQPVGIEGRSGERLLAQSAPLDAVAAFWWCAVNFDVIWETLVNSDPLASIWRDTELYDVPKVV